MNDGLHITNSSLATSNPKTNANLKRAVIQALGVEQNIQGIEDAGRLPGRAPFTLTVLRLAVDSAPENGMVPDERLAMLIIRQSDREMIVDQASVALLPLDG